MINETLDKAERLCSKKLIDSLFMGGGHSMVAFPLRVVYMKVKADDEDSFQSEMLVSVPKRYFKRAVKRNRVKRQVREAYRKNKHILTDKMETLPGEKLVLAFIWLDGSLHDSIQVDKKVTSLLQRLSEKL